MPVVQAHFVVVEVVVAAVVVEWWGLRPAAAVAAAVMAAIKMWRRRGAQAKLTLSWWLVRGLVDHASHRSRPAPTRSAAMSLMARQR